MKPVAIIRHARTEEPGHFATVLESNRISWRLIAADCGEAIPRGSETFSGIAMMGGPMSVNDPLPWIADECALIRDAVARGVPLIGHCLGGQLISKALGGQVTDSPAREVGWRPIKLAADPLSRDWFGGTASEAIVFQWHGETFSIPTGATRIATGEDCPNQAFALGPHLAMQFHIEMTEDLIRTWCSDWRQSFDGGRSRVSTIQSPDEMLTQMTTHLEPMRRLAERLYGRWLRGLRG
jgi:GMP synthase-like glutamine amidotransferase